MYIVLAATVLIAAGYLAVRQRNKLRHTQAKAYYDERLCELMEYSSRPTYPYYKVNPCFQEGLAYLATFPKKTLDDSRVYMELDRIYHRHLDFLLKEVERRLTSGVPSDWFSLEILFDQNRDWLDFDETACAWYGTRTSKSTHVPSATKELLLDARKKCFAYIDLQRRNDDERRKQLLAKNHQREGRLVVERLGNNDYFICGA